MDNVADAVKQTPTFGGCFTADTRIKTKDGSKNISDIKVGDEVYSENPETGETGYQKVAQVFVVKTNTILTIKTQSETIETTKPHPFYVIGKGFVAAKDLQVGDHLKMANGEEAVIESLTLTHHDDPITVYNFEVENWHTYHVSGSEVLVHNISKNACANAGENKYRGVKHGDTRNPSGDGLDSHHMPSKQVRLLGFDDGPTIQMDPFDHRRTASYGGREGSPQQIYRDMQKELIDQGKFDDAFLMDVDDKYDDAILEAIDSLPEF